MKPKVGARVLVCGNARNAERAFTAEGKRCTGKDVWTRQTGTRT